MSERSEIYGKIIVRGPADQSPFRLSRLFN